MQYIKTMPRFKNPKFAFRRNQLPNTSQYYRQQGLRLTGGGEWKSAICSFHPDKNPSLRLRLDSGGFRCMTCDSSKQQKHLAHGRNNQLIEKPKNATRTLATGITANGFKSQAYMNTLIRVDSITIIRGELPC